MRHLIRLARVLPLLAIAAVPSARLLAQDNASVEALAPVLATEDSRQWNEAVLRRGATYADTVVRSRTALAIGRIGDSQGLPLLLTLLNDPEINVSPYAAFALGLLRDSTASATIIRQLTTTPNKDLSTALEMVTALGRIGGRDAAEFYANALSGQAQLAVSDTIYNLVLQQFVGDAWRLGPEAPVNGIVRFLTDTSSQSRWRAAYTLGRLPGAAKAAGVPMGSALADQLALVRAFAARALNRSWVDSAGLDHQSTADLLARSLSDDDPSVRINALRSLGTFHLPAMSARAARLLADAQPNVAVQAAMTLGDLCGPDAVAALEKSLDPKKGFAMRTTALVALAHCDSAATRKALPDFAGSTDWRDRAVAATAAAAAFPDGAQAFASDPDPRVVATALDAWGTSPLATDAELIPRARSLLASPDFAVRAAAARALARAPTPGDATSLAGMLRRAQVDSAPDAALAALDGLLVIWKGSAAGKAAVESEFLKTTPRQGDYLLRAWAESNWPDLASKWGPVSPIGTGRTMQDYRDLVRRFMLPSSPDRLPHVFIEVDQKGTIELELFGSEAPITVANYIRLTDRRYFDRARFHRVVPNFVIQDGDPRGDGNGAPAYEIRDEINMHRYMTPTIGMALSGPDTGGSQWFINLSPQPSLDGIYTTFGRVVNGTGTLQHVVQGDLIRSIHQ